MPINPASGVLQNAGDTVVAQLGATGVGQGADPTAILSLTGAFTAATIAIEAVPLGQPMAPATGPLSSFSQSPVAESEWIPIGEVGVLDGISVSSPVGPLNSTGLPGSGYGFDVAVGKYQQIRLRLVSIGSGAIQGGIATVPFPVGSALTQQLAVLAGILLEVQRCRVGIELVMSNGDQPDDLAKSVPSTLTSGN